MEPPAMIVDVGINGGGMDCRAESKAANAGWASRRVSSDSGSDRVAFGVAKPKPNEVVNEKESGADRRADAGGFQSDIVGAARNVAESSN
jgi:hypothetical protein